MKRILVVDDDAAIRGMLKQMLEREDYQVTCASNGQEALDLLPQVKAEVVITDLIMPDKEGIELIRELKMSYPDLPIIAMSGGNPRINSHLHLKMAGLLGARVCFQKPLRRAELLAALAEL